jgi:hypothetical protein
MTFLVNFIVTHLIKELTCFFETHLFKHWFYRCTLWTLLWAPWSHSTDSYSISLKSVLILSSCLWLNPLGLACRKKQLLLKHIRFQSHNTNSLFELICNQAVCQYYLGHGFLRIYYCSLVFSKRFRPLLVSSALLFKVSYVVTLTAMQHSYAIVPGF